MQQQEPIIIDNRIVVRLDNNIFTIQILEQLKNKGIDTSTYQTFDTLTHSHYLITHQLRQIFASFNDENARISILRKLLLTSKDGIMNINLIKNLKQNKIDVTNDRNLNQKDLRKYSDDITINISVDLLEKFIMTLIYIHKTEPIVDYKAAVNMHYSLIDE